MSLTLISSTPKLTRQCEQTRLLNMNFLLLRNPESLNEEAAVRSD
jgi:hypothetical protein